MNLLQGDILNIIFQKLKSNLHVFCGLLEIVNLEILMGFDKKGCL